MGRKIVVCKDCTQYFDKEGRLQKDLLGDVAREIRKYSQFRRYDEIEVELKGATKDFEKYAEGLRSRFFYPKPEVPNFENGEAIPAIAGYAVALFCIIHGDPALAAAWGSAASMFPFLYLKKYLKYRKGKKLSSLPIKITVRS